MELHFHLFSELTSNTLFSVFCQVCANSHLSVIVLVAAYISAELTHHTARPACPSSGR